MGTFSKTFGACLAQQGARLSQYRITEEDTNMYLTEEDSNKIIIQEDEN